MRVRDLVDRVEIGSDAVIIRIDVTRLLNKVEDGNETTIEDSIHADAPFDLRIPVKLRRRGSELKLVVADRQPAPNSDRSLISNLARGFSWADELRTGLVESLGHSRSLYVRSPWKTSSANACG